MMCVLYHGLVFFSITKLLISAPIRTIYMQKYTHIIERTIVVKLPYITEKPSNVFKYIEKIGIWKVIGTFFTVILIFLIVNIILIWIVGYVPMLGILIIIIDAYLIFFAYMATGLLYSEID